MPGVTVKGVLAAVLLALMGGAWWWTLSQPAFRPATTVAAPPAAPPRASASTDAPPEVALHRLHPGPSAPVDGGGRDPFASGTARPTTVTSGPSEERSSGRAGEAPATEAAPAWPRLELIGIGARTTGTATRVAVLAGERGVVHATAGDIVAEVYRVDRVSDDAVDVTRLPDSRAFTLRLR
jgi:hypothetical protein